MILRYIYSCLLALLCCSTFAQTHCVRVTRDNVPVYRSTQPDDGTHIAILGTGDCLTLASDQRERLLESADRADLYVQVAVSRSDGGQIRGYVLANSLRLSSVRSTVAPPRQIAPALPSPSRTTNWVAYRVTTLKTPLNLRRSPDRSGRWARRR